MSLTAEEYKHHVTSVWRVTLILGIVTVVEVTFANLWDYYIGESGPGWAINLFMIVASLLKAFYITSVFMHLKYERTALILTIATPLTFFIWFLISFLMEGTAWLELRNSFG